MHSKVELLLLLHQAPQLLTPAYVSKVELFLLLH
jgi:hypothetical protein